ncbi:hypothetical protein [Halodurantibacterium flavum]|uniref:Excalibur calcium-binding domain-containing protein n=1 Tax=Halodurantibacterium flavum TaxID=1382802 RepID=A0ABW4SBB1_9RHOB
MRFAMAVVGFVALAACQGGGQDGYNEFMRERSAGGPSAASSYSPITGAPVSSGPIGAAPANSFDTAQAGQAGAPRISDEQDFDAVAARESIESDRERLERQRAQYVFIEPTALPDRPNADGPNIIQYALSTRNNPGDTIYRRMNPLRFSQAERACAQFTTQDQAQLEFLRRGGPERDPMNVDPDGDGFACWWDPRPYRAAMR